MFGTEQRKCNMLLLTCGADNTLQLGECPMCCSHYTVKDLITNHGLNKLFWASLTVIWTPLLIVCTADDLKNELFVSFVDIVCREKRMSLEILQSPNSSVARGAVQFFVIGKIGYVQLPPGFSDGYVTFVNPKRASRDVPRLIARLTSKLLSHIGRVQRSVQSWPDRKSGKENILVLVNRPPHEDLLVSRLEPYCLMRSFVPDGYRWEQVSSKATQMDVSLRVIWRWGDATDLRFVNAVCDILNKRKMNMVKQGSGYAWAGCQMIMLDGLKRLSWRLQGNGPLCVMIGDRQQSLLYAIGGHLGSAHKNHLQYIQRQVFGFTDRVAESIRERCCSWPSKPAMGKLAR